MIHRTLLLLSMLGLCTPVRADESSTTSGHRRLTIEKARQVLKISTMAADNGMQDLSLRAFREALAGGPPLPETPSPGDAFAISRGVTRRGPADAAREQQFVVDEIESIINDLDSLWHTKQFDPVAVYATLHAIVFAENTDRDANLYRRTVTDPLGDPASFSRNLGTRLIRWSFAAGRSRELAAELQTITGADPSFSLKLLRLELALQQNDEVAVSSALKICASAVESVVDSRLIQHAGLLAVRAAGHPETFLESLPLLEAAISDAERIAPRRGTDRADASLLLLLARFYFEAGNAEKGHAVIARYLAAGEGISNGTGPARSTSVTQRNSYDAHVAKRRMEQVAEVLLRTGHTADAIKQLASANEISTAYENSGRDSTIRDLLLINVLQSESPDTRYELLRQLCLQKGSGAECHFPTAILPAERPPAEFSSRTPELDQPFDSGASTGHTVSTAVLLVETAAQLGRLTELRAELESLHQTEVHNAIQALAICQCRTDTPGQAVPVLDDVTAHLIRASETGDVSANLLLSYVAASEAIEQPETRDAGLRLLEAGRRHAQVTGQNDLLSLYRRGILDAVSRVSDGAVDQLIPGAQPAHWIPSSTATPKTQQLSHPDPIWMALENVIHHHSGAGDDALYLRWPLIGDFEFTVEAWDSTGSESDLGYGGISVESHRHINRVRVNSIGRDSSIYRNGTFNAADSYARRSVRVSAEGITYSVNGHPVHQDARTENSSPWLMLFCNSSSTAFWRNPRITGLPVIPREVRLSDDPAMRGWTADLLNRSRSDPSLMNETAALIPVSDFDWAWVDGQIVGQFRIGSSDAQVATMLRSPSQSLLQYNRPLLEGESISWEFENHPDAMGVSPALGRLVFLLKPEGVRMHWAVSETSNWTMLGADNEVPLPSGTKPLNLSDGWNSASLSLHGQTVRITLNGSQIAEYLLETNASRRFGFFHYPGHTEARTRNVVMTGDWPESLTPQDSMQLTATRDPRPSPEATAMLHEILGERPFAANSLQEVRRFAELPVRDRYEALLRYVFPRSAHFNYRFAGDTTPSDPPPNDPFASLTSATTFPEHMLSGTRRKDSGGRLVSPVLMLIETAGEMSGLDELQAMVESRPGNTPYAKRCRIALLALIHLERGDFPAARELLAELEQLADDMPDQPAYERWMEPIVATKAMARNETLPIATQMLERLFNEQIRTGSSTDTVWNQHVRALHSRSALLEREQAGGALLSAVSGWQPVRRLSAESRGLGLPFPAWTQAPAPDGTIKHLPGHTHDFLYFPVPLTGDFEFECELSGFGEHAAQVGYGDFIPELKESLDAVRIFGIARDLPDARLATPLRDVGPWYHYRLVVENGMQTAFVNGIQIISPPVPAHRDPWLVIRCAGASDGGIRAIRLRGDAVIPAEVRLDVSSRLIGWSSEYFQEAIHPPSRDWSRNSDWTVLSSVLTGRRRAERIGMEDERLLQCHRPMLEDGVISYEFFYQSDDVMVHPAMDRLAFLLDETNGVRIHWITDGHNNRSGLAAGNISDEPENQLQRVLPLLAGDWNRMEVRLTGDTVTLTLNETDIFRRRLEDTNQRVFGLFHFQGRTTARVRNVVWKGDWSKTLPAWVNP